MQAELARAEAVRAAMPEGGMFAAKDWLAAPEPFALSEKFVDELEKLGYRLHLFVRACNLLYQQSIKGRQPAWVADYLDRGKPPELLEASRAKALRDEIPRVIRPDIILTENGFVLSELDNVPGGIGLTGWLGETYAAHGFDVVGGAAGMADGFRAILPGGAKILVSEEAATYRPEMEWLATRLGAGYGVERAEDFDPATSSSVFRFFELFDLPNLPSSAALMQASAEGRATVTPPFKPQLEEKMWFALFWSHPLRDFWRRELSERHWLKLREVIPQTWIMDPAPLPHFGVIPGLEIQDWNELSDFTHKQREIIVKISGFHEKAWGARGVVLGSDVSHNDWRGTVSSALEAFPAHPYIAQRFMKGRLVQQRYVDPQTGELRTMQGRVRLCPYYFVSGGKTQLGGVLSTVCPADKKLLHGMKDAIISPCHVVRES